ncbi:hypothetical protein PHMEG_0008403 [Phytophthora megakarya]|uniref:DDE Tnp4 domain-containing protein n=1 Tax=Phytophthora megakarya TaxID=4795 RepID=A0A225WIV3_9STRA|nr:hypothetical protein PHMEG_0008403 [Phytophthora megakarya]
MDDVTAAILAVVVAASLSAVIATADKRGLRRPPKTPKTFNTRAFETVLGTPGTGWFHDKLRCDKKSFLRIYRLVHSAWGREPGPKTKNPVIKRVALTRLYLAKGGTMDQAATALGISRPRSVVYINETLDVLSTMAKYMYCRKNFPAVNVQAIVDHRGLFRSISIRSGSNNDQSLWNGSGVKKRISSYCLLESICWWMPATNLGSHLTPFPEADAIQDPRKRRYNKAHSRTRIVVECAVGCLKNRFHVLLGKLEQKTSDRICKIILGCAILHNMLTLMRDGLPILGEDPLLQDVSAPVSEDPVEKEQAVCHQQGIAKRNDIADILMHCS